MGRKDNGSGGVYKINDNKYSARIMIGRGEDGKPIIKTFYAKTEALAKKKLRDFKKEMGNAMPKRDITVSEFATKWLNSRKTTMKPLSFNRVLSTYKTHVHGKIGHLLMRNVAPNDIQEIIDGMMDGSYSSAKKAFDFVNAMFSYAMKFPPTVRVVDYNPCDFVNMPRQRMFTQTTPTSASGFTNEEVGKIIAEIDRASDNNGSKVYPYGDFFVVLLNTGLRMGEGLALLKSDVDFDNGVIYVNKNLIQLQTETGYEIVVQDDTKTFASTRVVPMNTETRKRLKSLFETFPDTEFIAINRNGNRITPQNCEKTFSTILNRCGVDANHRKCHALRHTFATAMFENGADVKTISEILGHSSVSITYDVYIDAINLAQAKFKTIGDNIFAS